MFTDPFTDEEEAIAKEVQDRLLFAEGLYGGRTRLVKLVGTECLCDQTMTHPPHQQSEGRYCLGLRTDGCKWVMNLSFPNEDGSVTIYGAFIDERLPTVDPLRAVAVAAA